MPWEIIADFRKRKDMGPDDERWGKLAVAFVSKLVELEPALRFLVKNLPLPGRPQTVFHGLGAQDVPAVLHDHLEVKEPKTHLVRQYTCNTCKAAGKKSWVPQMYLAAHEGHDLTKGPPTARAYKEPWRVDHRLFIGTPSRLAGLHGVMPSAALTTMPESAELLGTYDWALLLPMPAAPPDADVAELKTLAGLEEVIVLPPKPVDATRRLLEWMVGEDPKALHGSEPEQTAEQVQRRIKAAEAYLAGKTREIEDKRREQAAIAAKGP